MTSDQAPPADVQLPTRRGLPDDIAYLRAAYPRARWQGLANFGELADFWLQVHDSLRRQGGQLKQATDAFGRGEWPAGADFPSVFVPRFNQFLGHLNGHHQIEDSAYFPRFRALDPRMGAGFAILEADHRLIHEQIVASVDAARALLRALAQDADAQRRAADAYGGAADRLLDLLGRHLADEEDLVIPAMLEHGERSLA
ncbi:MAG: hemerythrin domain-containing protein [Caulobacteraceae bacterium]